MGCDLPHPERSARGPEPQNEFHIAERRDGAQFRADILPEGIPGASRAVRPP
jgi:hypothetical protein